MHSACSIEEVSQLRSFFVAKNAAPDDHDTEPVFAALRARLGMIEAEIVRLTNLASNSEDRDQQEEYWQLARDLQRDAREIRAEINSRARTGSGNA